MVRVGFSTLALADQMTLLQQTWLDILCWNFAYRSATNKPATLVFSDDFKVSYLTTFLWCCLWTRIRPLLLKLLVYIH